ncbi:MAG: hypothetical protein E5Y89_02630 [Mesorhizobium sp.]|nr:MAG: hypothetical protein E5Y89_02630 [Mesorhizobium sp.]
MPKFIAVERGKLINTDHIVRVSDTIHPGGDRESYRVVTTRDGETHQISDDTYYLHLCRSEQMIPAAAGYYHLHPTDDGGFEAWPIVAWAVVDDETERFAKPVLGNATFSASYWYILSPNGSVTSGYADRYWPSVDVWLAKMNADRATAVLVA